MNFHEQFVNIHEHQYELRLFNILNLVCVILAYLVHAPPEILVNHEEPQFHERPCWNQTMVGHGHHVILFSTMFNHGQPYWTMVKKPWLTMVKMVLNGEPWSTMLHNWSMIEQSGYFIVNHGQPCCIAVTMVSYLIKTTVTIVLIRWVWGWLLSFMINWLVTMFSPSVRSVTQGTPG